MSWKHYSGLFLVAFALPCLGQQFGMSGPISGFVFDEPTRSIRPIAGLPGAARLGGALSQDIDWATVSPDGRVALFQKHGEVRLLQLNVDSPDTDGVPVSGVIDSPNLSTWSRDSSAVGLYSSATNQLQWIRLTGQEVIPDPPLALAGVDGKVIGLCGHHASNSFFAAVAGNGVYRVNGLTGTSMLLELPGVSALAVQTNGQTLWVADRAGARVIEIANPAGDPEARELIHDDGKLTDISAIAVSADTNSLYLADRATSRLYTFERSRTILPEGIEIDMPATSFTALGRPSLLLLGQRKMVGDPLYVLELGANPGIFFIPAGAGQ